MSPDSELVSRLEALPQLAKIPLAELQWLAEHGRLETHEPGTVMAPKGKPVKILWIVISGQVSVRVDHGAGLRNVMSWHPGEVSGMLPYSRMHGPPGDNYLEQRSELLIVDTKHFPEMVSRCPQFTAYTVHSMIDRARSFNTSELQDEKMISLGKLAAGLAHEINNPASATVRNAKLLRSGLAEADTSSREFGKLGLTGPMVELLTKVRNGCIAEPPAMLSPIEQSDRTDSITDWLERHKCDPRLTGPLVETSVTIAALDTIAGAIPPDRLSPSLQWLGASCSTHMLAMEIENAATRIHGLVAAVKDFTYMDNLAGPELVDIEPGLRNTVRVIAGKARGKNASVRIEVENDLPRVYATGGELNQVWLNLVDNAIDAVGDGGVIEIVARRVLDMVEVRVIDNGPGIPQELLTRVFDPFFTTKPPGQGTGLGLDITRRLLRRYHGDIVFESRPGRTECRVTLIAVKEEPGE